MTAISTGQATPDGERVGRALRRVSNSLVARVLGTEEEFPVHRRESEPATQVFNPTLWATGREEPVDLTRRRSSRLAGNISCDLEAQDESDSGSD